MERTVTFRFYKIGRHKESDPSLLSVLDEIAKLKPRKKREQLIDTDFVVRLEEYEKSGPNAVVGEIIRVQTTNMPSEVEDDGRVPLTTENPLGHGIVFRFDHAKSVLGIQHDPRIVSAGRFLDYVQTCWPEANYTILPMLKPAAWERFNKGEITKLVFRLANPENLGSIGDAHASAAAGIRAMGEAYDAPSVKVELSMGSGRRHGHLAEAVKGLAKGIVNSAKEGAFGVEALQAVAYVDDARDEIDLIEERLKVRENLPLDDKDPEKNYKIKKAFLTRKMVEEIGK